LVRVKGDRTAWALLLRCSMNRSIIEIIFYIVKREWGRNGVLWC